MKPGSISIVVISYNTKERLATCLSSLLREIRPGADDIAVVDNASWDGSAEMVRTRFPSVTLLANDENRGFSFACNRGLAVSKGDYVIFANGDTVVPNGSLDKIRS